MFLAKGLCDGIIINVPGGVWVGRWCGGGAGGSLCVWGGSRRHCWGFTIEVSLQHCLSRAQIWQLPWLDKALVLIQLPRVLHDGWLCEACRPPPQLHHSSAGSTGARQAFNRLIKWEWEDPTAGALEGPGPDLALEAGRLGQTGIDWPGHMASQSVTVKGYMLWQRAAGPNNYVVNNLDKRQGNDWWFSFYIITLYRNKYETEKLCAFNLLVSILHCLHRIWSLEAVFKTWFWDIILCNLRTLYYWGIWAYIPLKPNCMLFLYSVILIPSQSGCPLSGTNAVLLGPSLTLTVHND